jgi:FxsC-like protein
MAYLFFLSYARKDNEHNKDDDNVGLIREFYLDLRDLIRRKTGLPDQEIGFFDGEAIEAGAQWLDELTDGLQRCQTFVSIYSPTYFTKEFCGREWAVFSRRQQRYAASLANGAEAPRLILPVLWEKELYVQRRLPEALKAVQFKQDAFGANYPKYGLRQIMSDENLKKAYYQAFLESFSDQLIEAADAHPAMPALANLEPLDRVTPTFPAQAAAVHTPGAQTAQAATANPRYVKFSFVAARQAELQSANVRQQLESYGGSGAEWLPFLPDVKEEIDITVKDITIDCKLSPEGTISLDQNFMQQVEEAGRNNQIVVILVDTWTLRLPIYRQLMNVFDQKSFLNCIVVVPWNAQDAETAANRETLEKYLNAAMPNLSLNKPPNFLGDISSRDELRKELVAKLLETKQKIMALAQVRWIVTDEENRFKPVVTGPAKIG